MFWRVLVSLLAGLGSWGMVALGTETRCDGAPAEARLQLLGGDYQCRKVGCAPQQGSPLLVPTPPPMRVMCDGGYGLLVFSGESSARLDSFSTKERCLRAVEQFRSTSGCYCTADFKPRCVVQGTTGLKVQDMGNGFSRIESCIEALQQLSGATPVKAR